VVAVAGRCDLTPEQLRAAGFDRCYALAELEPDPARSVADAAALLEELGARLATDYLS
jgi:glycerate 2-kinase